jgi:taurine dioxygenase
MKRTLEGRRAVFDFRGRKRSFPPTQAEIDRNPPVRHPIVRTHPRTGRKCLYVMRDDCTGIEGIEADEAEGLIAALADHIVKPAFVYRHQWRSGDVLMLDNCMVQHRAIQDYDMPQRRLMHRTTMGGHGPRVSQGFPAATRRRSVSSGLEPRRTGGPHVPVPALT